MNTGKGIDEVKERQRRRKIMALKESCKKAMWFADSFHLDLASVIFRTRKSKEVLSLDYTQLDPDVPSSSSNSSNNTLYQVLYLLDRFGVSDEFYHELSMVNPTLPRTYTIKHARERISSFTEIKRLPQPFLGCYRSLRESLVQSLTAEVMNK